eukprot:194586-Chlamydomonas_euryale.AAC.2
MRAQSKTPSERKAPRPSRGRRLDAEGDSSVALREHMASWLELAPHLLHGPSQTLLARLQLNHVSQPPARLHTTAHSSALTALFLHAPERPSAPLEMRRGLIRRFGHRAAAHISSSRSGVPQCMSAFAESAKQNNDKTIM